MRIFAAFFIVAALCVNMSAQDAVDSGTRTQQIQNEQDAKAQTLFPDVPPKPERRFTRIQHDVEEVFSRAPVHLQFGDLPMASGFSLGPVQEWENSTDTLRTRVWAIGSVYKFYNFGVGIKLPRVTSQRLAVTVDASRADSPRFDFYGLGATSLKSNRTDYRREDTVANLGVVWPLLDHIQPDCNLTQDFLNVGPGTNPNVTPTNEKFGPVQAPGINYQTNYWMTGCTVPVDFRDNPEFPHAGTAAFFRYEHFGAEDIPENSFNRVSGSAEQYIPFWNKKRVIALHAATELSLHSDRRVVPFYMMPTLGGYDDLRGFRPRRFYDENSFVMNAEYRWEICTGFEMALFADSGKVFHRPGDFNFHDLQTDAGFGLRFNNQQSTVMRIDTGFSREGFQVWFVFNKLF